MTTRRRTTVAVVAGVFALSAIGAAIADEHDEEPVEESTETDVSTIWDDEGHVLVVTLDDDGACDDVTVERTEEGELVIQVGGEDLGDENPLPDGCFVFDGEGKDGKVNHGTIVSSVGKNLSPHDIDVPKGHIMREVAKIKDFTKVKGDNGDDDGLEEAEADKAGKPDKPGRGNGNGRGHSK